MDSRPFTAIVTTDSDTPHCTPIPASYDGTQSHGNKDYVQRFTSKHPSRRNRRTIGTLFFPVASLPFHVATPPPSPWCNDCTQHPAPLWDASRLLSSPSTPPPPSPLHRHHQYHRDHAQRLRRLRRFDFGHTHVFSALSQAQIELTETERRGSVTCAASFAPSYYCTFQPYPHTHPSSASFRDLRHTI